MDAVKFLQERNRMYERGAATPSIGLEDDYDPVIAVKVVEEWSAAHPRKTRQDVFLGQYPEAYVAKSTGLIDIQPCFIDKTLNPRGCVKKCVDCKREFWMQDVE